MGEWEDGRVGGWEIGKVRGWEGEGAEPPPTGHGCGRRHIDEPTHVDLSHPLPPPSAAPMSTPRGTPNQMGSERSACGSARNGHNGFDAFEGRRARADASKAYEQAKQRAATSSVFAELNYPADVY